MLEMNKGSMPYSNHTLAEHNQTGYHRQERTLWSVCMMIFALFAGPDLVETFTTQDEVVSGLIFIQNELGNRLQSLIRGLLFEVRFDAITKALEDGVLNNPERAVMAVRGVARKIAGSNYLEQRLR